MNRGIVRPSLARFSMITALLVLSAVAMSGCGVAGGATPQPPAPAQLNVSAATSLRDVLEAAAPGFELANNVELVFNFGASGVLQKQIESGAPADVFLSASPAQVDSLIAEGFVSSDASSTFASNTLVLARSVDAPPITLADLKQARLVAMGDPDTTPQGALTRQFLTRIGLWRALQNRVTLGANAEQTMSHIAGNEVDAGFVFGSQLTGSDDVTAVATVPSTAIDPIRHVGAPLVGSPRHAVAQAYMEHLSSPAVQRAFADAGFLPASGKWVSHD